MGGDMNLTERYSMPPGGSLAGPSQSMDFGNRERLYRVWPGNNRFLCGGRLVFGPDGRSLYLSSFLIGCPAFMFCIRMLVRIKEHDPLYGYGVLITGVVATFLVLMFLFMTSSRDPGIVPRNFRPIDDEEAESIGPAVDWSSGKIPTRLPRTKDVTLNGFTIKVKFCDTCKLYRPPRASHCSICNNCVQRFDHHCPWVGQCIAQRNYRYFILFISSSTILCIYVFTFSLVNLLRHQKGVLHSLSDDIVSVILVVYCFVVVWFVGGLTIFHFYLMSTNQTTYENFRYRYEKDRNPHNLGYCNNLKQIFCSKIPTSAVNFREMVVVEDVMPPETPTYHNSGYPEFRKGQSMEKFAKNGSTVQPNTEDMDSEMKNKMKKENGVSEEENTSRGERSRVQDVVSSKKNENLDAC